MASSWPYWTVPITETRIIGSGASCPAGIAPAVNNPRSAAEQKVRRKSWWFLIRAEKIDEMSQHRVAVLSKKRVARMETAETSPAAPGWRAFVKWTKVPCGMTG